MIDKPTKSELTRQRILDAAAKVFRSHGYSGARLSDIATLAGIRTGSMYYHFESREALVEEVLHLGIAVAWAHVRDALEALPIDATPLVRVKAAIRAHTEVQLEISDYSSAHARIIGQVPSDVRRRNLVDQINYGEYWDRLFKAAVASGEMRDDVDPYVARMLMFGALNWTSEWFRPGTGRSAELIAEQAIAILTQGIQRADDQGYQTASLPPPRRRAARRHLG